MQHIADRLGKLGMPEYVERFTENGIDISVLRYLTDQDLEKIDVLLGHRQRYLRPLASLLAHRRRRQNPSQQRSRSRDTAERRQVTVRLDGALRLHGPGGPTRNFSSCSLLLRTQLVEHVER
jgi:hypothetical protein